MSIKKQFLVQLKRRTSANTWDTAWTNITPWFVDRESDVGNEIDDLTFQGKIEQQSVSIRFKNTSGKFNPAGTTGSLWQGVQYLYHSRIRFYEWATDESWDGTNDLSFLPLIDGLLAEEPKYYLNNDCQLTISSMLDILRSHFILEESVSRFNLLTSQSIIRYCIDLYNTTYSELGVTTTGGVVRNEIFYHNIEVYGRTLYNLVQSVISDGGGIGGLTADKTLFFTYYGNTPITGSMFTENANTIGLYTFDDVDYNSIYTAVNKSTHASALDDLNAWNTFNYNDVRTAASMRKTKGFFNTDNHAFAHCNIYLISPARTETAYTINMINYMYFDSLPTNLTRIRYSATEDAIYYPLFIWEDYNTNDVEGFVLMGGEYLYYIKQVNFVLVYSVKIGEIPREKTWYLLSILVDGATNLVSVCLNGKLLNSVYAPAGIINSISKESMYINRPTQLVNGWEAENTVPVTGFTDYFETYYPGCLMFCAGFRIDNTVDIANFENNSFNVFRALTGSSYDIS